VEHVEVQHLQPHKVSAVSMLSELSGNTWTFFAVEISDVVFGVMM